MAADDERFARIAGQKFLMIEPGGSRAPSQGWIDPRDLETRSLVSAEKPKAVPVREHVDEPAAVGRITEINPADSRHGAPAEPSLTAQTLDPTPASASAPEEKAPASAELAFVNTPLAQGQMLGGRPVPTAPEWRTSVPVAPALSDDKVVKTGAKIRIGS